MSRALMDDMRDRRKQMITVQEALQKELRRTEQKVAQLRGKMARLKSYSPDALSVKGDRIHILAHSRGVSITIHDTERKQPELPAKLLSMSSTHLSKKKRYEIDDRAMEFFSFRIAGLSIDLDRKARMTPKCRKARIEKVVDICGDVPADMEVLEWIEE
jgi:hypothetical protein